MKSASYITRLFKGYKITRFRVEHDNQNKCTWYHFELTKNGRVTCVYTILIRQNEERLTAKARREQAQAKELIKALQALPKY